MFYNTYAVLKILAMEKAIVSEKLDLKLEKAGADRQILLIETYNYVIFKIIKSLVWRII